MKYRIAIRKWVIGDGDGLFAVVPVLQVLEQGVADNVLGDRTGMDRHGVVDGVGLFNFSASQNLKSDLLTESNFIHFYITWLYVNYVKIDFKHEIAKILKYSRIRIHPVNKILDK